MYGSSKKFMAPILACVLVPALFTTSAKADFGACKNGTTVVCGATINLPDTPAGSTSNVHIPATVLGDAYNTHADLYFTADCVIDPNGGTSFHVNDVDKISCSAFPCQTSNVRYCDASIPVNGGTALGGTVHVPVPATAGRGTLTVQCVGSLDEPPVYKITEHAGVTCNAPSAP